MLEIGSVEIAVSNLDKVFYPKTGFTKGQVIDYYVGVSSALLPHLQERPLVLKRYPEGVESPFFYEKRCPSFRPKWLKTKAVPRSGGGAINYCVVDDLPGLVWAANLADLELHTFLHKTKAIDRPTALAFDLDPGAPADILACCNVALKLKSFFDALRLKAFAKTSGSKGMQVYVPLNTAVTYEQTKNFARELAFLLERRFPALVVSKMAKAARAGKVFVDWSQNDAAKTTINVYSLRARERPTVSTPIEWKEVTSAFQKQNAAALVFEAADVARRIEQHDDLFADVLTLKQKLPRKL